MMSNIYRHGDILLLPVDKMPGKTKAVRRQHGRLVLAEGEVTGHAHVIEDQAAKLVTADQAAELYLLVHGTEPVSLTHEEHRTILVPPGQYRVMRQVEYTPEELRAVAD